MYAAISGIGRLLIDRSGAAPVSFIGLSAGVVVLGFVVVTPIVAKGDPLTAATVIDALFARTGSVADFLFAHVGHRPPLL